MVGDVSAWVLYATALLIRWQTPNTIILYILTTDPPSINQGPFHSAQTPNTFILYRPPILYINPFISHRPPILYQPFHCAQTPQYQFFQYINLFIINLFVRTDPQYYHPFRLLLNYINSVRMRGQYYFVWLLTESINITGGFGYCGCDERGKAKWDLATSVKLWDIEFGTSLRMIINGWNFRTHVWLRRWAVCMYVCMCGLSTYIYTVK